MPSDLEHPIDNPLQTERLLARLSACVPFPVFVEPRLAAVIREKLPAFSASRPCEVSEVRYFADYGGITCDLDVPGANGEVFVASITHLVVDARMPLARDIAAYKKHRIKRLRRANRLAAQENLGPLG